MPKSVRIPKHEHEVRDPIHTFIHFDSDERKVIDSRPLQRLRHIHQLALTYLIYPGATHKRFEHSLGVMDLAGRVFDIVTRDQNVSENVRRLTPEISQPKKLMYWRTALRMAALCHDVGHLPFSHAAEQLLPDGWNHERLTREIILSGEMRSIWAEMTPRLTPEDVVKLAVGPRKASDLKPTIWETILSEIIVGDAFGVDRIDYLLRDSHHAGVSYGRFDHNRLLDTLRILPSHEPGAQPALGVEYGGLQSAEALIIARYLIYSQVYFHSVRRIYDIHLSDFLKQWLEEGKFSAELESHLSMTDNEVNAALRLAACDPAQPGHESARRIICREHFKVVYERNPADVQVNPDSASAIFRAAQQEFGTESVRVDRYRQKGGPYDFPVLHRDGTSLSSLDLSEILKKIPVFATDYVFVDREKLHEAEKWLEANRAAIIKEGRAKEDGEI
jgi:HD superfamily phosphohydrolase